MDNNNVVRHFLSSVPPAQRYLNNVSQYSEGVQIFAYTVKTASDTHKSCNICSAGNTQHDFELACVCTVSKTYFGDGNIKPKVLYRTVPSMNTGDPSMSVEKCKDNVGYTTAGAIHP